MVTVDERIARELIALNRRFYAEHAASFSATRGAAWEGWRRVVDVAREHGALGTGARVLDVACGNLRFEKLLLSETDGASFEFHAVDSTPALALPSVVAEAVEFRCADVLDDPAALEDLPAADLTVCFGFLHHVPTHARRKSLIRQLSAATRPGGIAAISFWQFMDDARLARKADETMERAIASPPFEGFSPAALNEGDHLLGWQDDERAFRYCHHTTDEEIDALVAALSAEEIERFSADGASGRLNRYIILKVAAA